MQKGHFPVDVAQTLVARLDAELITAHETLHKLLDMLAAADLTIVAIPGKGAVPARYAVFYKVGYNHAPRGGALRLPF